MNRDRIRKLIVTGHELSKEELHETQNRRPTSRKKLGAWIAAAIAVVGLVAATAVFLPRVLSALRPALESEGPTASAEQADPPAPSNSDGLAQAEPSTEAPHAEPDPAREPEAEETQPAASRQEEPSRADARPPEPTQGPEPEAQPKAPKKSELPAAEPAKSSVPDETESPNANANTDGTGKRAAVASSAPAGQPAAGPAAARDVAGAGDAANGEPAQAPGARETASPSRPPDAPEAEERQEAPPPRRGDRAGRPGPADIATMSEDELAAELRATFAPPDPMAGHAAPRRGSVRPQLEAVSAPVADEAARRSLTELVLVPGGELRFGAANEDGAALANERPAVTVTVDAFHLEAHEVTNRQYKAFLDATGYPTVPRSDDARFADYDWDPETRTYPEGLGDHPVVNITREDALAYAQWAGRRLPTEMEWEYAARYNAAEALYPWGNSLANRLFANYDGAKLLPVASYPPNGLGLYDLAGNAFEWMGHDYRAELHEALADGTDPAQLLTVGQEAYGLLRGGAFYSTAREVRSSYREYNDPTVRYPGYGLRLAADDPS